MIIFSVAGQLSYKLLKQTGKQRDNFFLQSLDYRLWIYYDLQDLQLVGWYKDKKIIKIKKVSL